MRYTILVVILLSLCFSSEAFGQRKELRKAKASFEEEDYFHCVDYYNQAKELGAVLGLEDRKNLAHSYFELNKIGQAFDIFSEIESNLSDEDIFTYAKVLHRYGLYEMAIEWYDKAKKSGSLSESVIHVNDMIASCRWALANESVMADFRVQPNFTLASMGQSFGVQIFEDKVVYSSAPKDSKNVDRNGNPFLNLYSSDIVDGVVAEKTNKVFSQNLVSPYHVGAISFTSDLRHMFYTKSIYVDNVPMLKIFVVDYNGDEWVNERVLEFDSDDFDLAHPAVSPDNKYLYFVSNMPNNTKIYGKSVRNFGGKDIYRAAFAGDVNHFTKVENLGSEINTYGDEVNPVVNPDGLLYFSSDTRKGFGGLDVFCAEYVGNKWQNARNMLKPFNSNVDDFCYVQFPDDPERGFISSNRYGDMDADVIFDVRKNKEVKETAEDMPPVFGTEGLVFGVEEVKTEEIVELEPKDVEAANFIFSTSVLSTFNNEVVPSAIVRIVDEQSDAEIVSGLTDNSGKITLEIAPSALGDNKEVIVTVSKEGYNEKTLQATGVELIEIGREGIRLTPIFNNQDLDDISGMSIAYYDDLDAEAKATLDKLASYLLKSPGVVVKLNAHTEAKGNRYRNLDISQKVADKAKDYLVSKGVNGDQLIPRGYGERYLKNRCNRGIYCDAAAHKLNRRIEVVVWNIKK